MFPRLKERGPIEAQGGRGNFKVRPPFPRLKERGPIEASPARKKASMGPRCFHA